MENNFTTVVIGRCGTTNNYTTLNALGVGSTCIFMLLTIPLNALIIFVLIKDRNQKRYINLFYKLLLNIAIADLLTGLVAYPSAINVVTREALVVRVSKTARYTAHLSIFFTDAVALCTLTLLSMDRAMAILSPVKHFKGMQLNTRYTLLTFTWLIGICLVLPYFKLKFIRQLVIFTIMNVTITVLSLIATIVMYRLKLKPKINGIHKYDMNEITRMPSNHNENNDNKDIEENRKNNKKTHKNRDQSINIKPPLISKKHERIQQRATRTFLIMLCVFVATYLPTVITMIFMNMCTTCNCLVVHIMRDVSVMSILSSSVLRPLNFIMTLKHLRIAVYQILGIKKNKARYDMTVSSASASKNL